MAQLSLYMDEAAMNELREDAEKANLSISAYAREVLEDRHESNGYWPEGYWERIYGSLDDPSFVVPDELDPAFDRIPDFGEV